MSTICKIYSYDFNHFNDFLSSIFLPTYVIIKSKYDYHILSSYFLISGSFFIF